MRQAGILVVVGKLTLTEQVDRLAEDHKINYVMRRIKEVNTAAA